MNLNKYVNWSLPIINKHESINPKKWQIINFAAKNQSIKQLITQIFHLLNIRNNTKTRQSVTHCDILVQVDNFLAGGLENVVIDINEALLTAGLHIGLLVLGETGTAVDRTRDLGIPIYILQFGPEKYKELLQKTAPKLVLTHYSIQGADICSQANIPFIQIIHNVYMWFTAQQSEEFQKAAEYTTLFIAYSEFAKAYSISRLGIPAEKCYVIPNGVDIQQIRAINHSTERIRLRENFHFSDSDFVFLSVAAINHQKNQMGMIKAFHSILSDCPNAKLVLLGPTYEKRLFEELESYIVQNNINEHIIYAGQSSTALIYYSMADAFICSSFFEGGPLALLEAVASNLPVISTKVGFAEVFENQKGVALIQPPEDIFSYHGSIEQLHSTKEFEINFANQLRKTYFTPTKPDIDKDIVDMMDKRYCYKAYVDCVTQLLLTGNTFPIIPIRSWVNRIIDS